MDGWNVFNENKADGNQTHARTIECHTNSDPSFFYIVT